MTHPAHGGVGLDVVPRRAHRLFERPRLAAFNWRSSLARASRNTRRGRASRRCQAATKSSAGSAGPEPADIEDPGDPPAGHEHVPGSQIPMGHDIGIVARQLAQVSPRSSQSSDIEQAFAVAQTLLHPLIVESQVTSATQPSEPKATGVEGADVDDELGQILGEPSRVSRVLVCCGESRQPRLYRPGQRGSRTRARRWRSARGLGIGFARAADGPPRPRPAAAAASSPRPHAVSAGILRRCDPRSGRWR